MAERLTDPPAPRALAARALSGATHRTGATALALVVFGLIAALLVAWSYARVEAPINTGDYGRIARSLFITVEHRAPLTDSYPIEPVAKLRHLVPLSSFGLLAMLLVGLHKLVGLASFHMASVFVALNLVYWLGGAFVVARADWLTRLLVTLAMALGYVGYAYMFKSLYEDVFVFVLCPWLLFGLREALLRGRHAVFIVASLLLVFAKVQMVFALPPVAAFLIWRRRGWVLLAHVALIALGMSKAAGFAEVNAYNRFYNGIGWTVQQVATWPASDFIARRAYFRAHQGELQARSQALEPGTAPDWLLAAAASLPDTTPGTSGAGAPSHPLDGGDLLGTSYWPAGYALLIAAQSTGRPELWDAIQARGRPGRMLMLMASRPRLALDWLRTSWLLFLGSGYELRYLHPAHRHADDEPWTDRINDAPGPGLLPSLLLLTVGALLAATRRRHRPVVLGFAWCLLLTPPFVAFGDGFFEYEKHIVPMAMLSVVLGLHLLCGLVVPDPKPVLARKPRLDRLGA